MHLYLLFKNCNTVSCKNCNAKNRFRKLLYCYLLFAPQKIRFQKLLYCYIVTLVMDIIDLFP